MKYKIEEIENSKGWDNFLKELEYINILSSWSWIEFERELGFNSKAYRIGEKGVFAFRIVLDTMIEVNLLGTFFD